MDILNEREINALLEAMKPDEECEAETDNIPEKTFTVTDITEKEYYDKIEGDIWYRDMPVILVFTEAGDPVCDEYLGALRVTALGAVDIPVYNIDIDKCPKVAEEFHVGHEDTVKVPTISKVPVVCIFTSGRNDMRIRSEDGGIGHVISCIRNYQMALYCKSDRK